jgi:hypothetical protein
MADEVSFAGNADLPAKFVRINSYFETTVLAGDRDGTKRRGY